MERNLCRASVMVFQLILSCDGRREGKRAERSGKGGAGDCGSDRANPWRRGAYHAGRTDQSTDDVLPSGNKRRKPDRSRRRMVG